MTLPAHVTIASDERHALRAAMRDAQTATADYYYCQWFAGKKLEQGRFPPDSLELVQPQAK